MKRHYFIADDIDELTRAHGDLLANGIGQEQIHVLSLDDGEVEGRHLHEVQAFMKRDIVRWTELGAAVGVIAAFATIAFAHLSGIAARTSWVPFAFLAVVLLGFATWEGGLFGIQTPNSRFRRFEEALRTGKHVLFVDATARDERAVAGVAALHPALHPAGTGTAAPSWVCSAQRGLKRFVQWAP
jgi:hypothetical protein